MPKPYQTDSIHLFKIFNNFRKEFSNSNKKSGVTKAAEWFTIGGTLVSLFLAIITFINTQEIDTLKDIAKEQRTEIDTLTEMFKELKVQTVLMSGQSESTSKELTVMQEQLQIAINNNNISKKGFLNRLNETLIDISRVIPRNFVDSIRYKTPILTECLSLLKRELNNPVLLDDKELFKQWKDFINVVQKNEGILTGKSAYITVMVPNYENKPFEEYYDVYYQKFRTAYRDFQIYVLTNFHKKYNIF
jgi:hypothetical protein